MVGQRTLNPFILVRIQASEQKKLYGHRKRNNGKNKRPAPNIT